MSLHCIVLCYAFFLLLLSFVFIGREVGIIVFSTLIFLLTDVKDEEKEEEEETVIL